MRVFRGALVIALFAGSAGAQEKSKSPPRRVTTLIYVVDAITLAPIPGAEVRDLMSRNSMKTEDAGVVGLLVPGFVKATGALIEVRKAGYRSSDRFLVSPGIDTAFVVHLLSDSAAKARASRQRKDSTVFFVDVFSEAGDYLADANVSVVAGLTNALDSRTTDTTGLALLHVAGASGDVQISVTRIGYRPYRQFYRLSVADTIVAQVVMQRVAQQLGAISVTARRLRTYTIDESDIANSKRPIANGLEVVSKLKPAMFGDRLRDMDGCGTADFIYVNGRRIHAWPDNVSIPRLPPQRVSSRSSRGQTSILRPSTSPPPGKRYGATDTVRAVLAGIKPEHIEQMSYVDCFDTSIPGVNRRNAIYVILKYGVEFDDRLGSVFTRDTTRRK